MQYDFDAPDIDSLRSGGRLKWEEAGSGGLGAGVAEMDFGPPPVVCDALVDAIQRGKVGYLPPSLEADVAAACAFWQQEAYGWNVPNSDVRLIPDVVRAFHIAVEYFSRPGSPVIVPTPAYTPFLTVPPLLRRQVLQVPLAFREGRYAYDLDGLEAAFRSGGNLLVICNPHNPTGRVLEVNELQSISLLVERYGGRVFADEIHAPLTFRGYLHRPYAAVSKLTAGHAITAVSASKAWNLAGLKCAQVILSSAEDRDRWSRLNRLATDGTSTLGAIAAAAAYRSGRPWLDAVRMHLGRNRARLSELLTEALPHVGYVPPEGTYLAWLDLRSVDAELRHRLYSGARDAVTVVDGSSCGRAGAGFARLNFATSGRILEGIVARMASDLSPWP